MTSDGHSSRRLRWPYAVGVAGVAVVGAGLWGITHNTTPLPRAGPPPQRAAPGPSRSSTPMRTVAHPALTPTTEVTVPSLPSGADRVEVPSLGLRAPVVPVNLSADDALAVPTSPSTLGWWMPQPSVLVIDGHVDSAVTGPGALFELRTLKPGATVDVQPAVGPIEYWRVDGLRTYTKGQLPRFLFDGPGTRLVIVTCGGPFDYATHHYYDNVVAYAAPVRT